MDFRNVNLVWTSVMAETLGRLGLETAVVCPGSRSAPLAIAFAQHPTIEAIPVLDERSAAFFALGLAKRSGKATALICSSGTAGANFFPAIIEARESRVPLLVLTGDRPPELRHCNAGQTIDQQKLYGSYPNAFVELALPSLEPSLLAYVRQTVRQAWEQTQHPVAGVVHLNCPFRDPLAPIAQPEAIALEPDFDADAFFATLQPTKASPPDAMALFQHPPLPQSDRGIIVAGVAQPRDPQRYCEAIAHLSKLTGFPVLAEGSSPVRNYLDSFPGLISTYDLMLRQPNLAKELAPDVVIRVGETPTSKVLRQWLQDTQPLQWIVDAGDHNLDPLHLRTTYLRCSVEQLVARLQHETPPVPSAYYHRWSHTENRFRHSIDETFTKTTAWIEGKVAWLLSQCLPVETPLFIANSMPVRTIEWFWKPGNSRVIPYVNRGANGIDGTLSTALGIAHRQAPSVLLTGDLALLHDTNGFLLLPKFHGHLTIVLINNHGGGIFETLPIAQFDPPFEEFFATPQAVDFARLAATYGIEHRVMTSWEELTDGLQALPSTGVRVLEVRCDRKANAQWLKARFGAIAPDLAKQ
ncbi:MAG: 2-succinyl-5-enolpyruvyl-6-hydroxy-3-cyclohexene-1-carboxylic-acid synthase [Cyanobacteria bacterium J06638_22]